MTTLSCVRPRLRRQFGVIRHDELLAAGLTISAVRHCIRRGDLRRVHRGVYIATAFPWTPQQDAFAAVSACAEGSAISHLTAAAHLSLLKAFPSRPEVTAPGTTGARGPKGVTLHHTRQLDAYIFNGIRTTTPEQTLNAIAPRLETPILKAAVRQAERAHGVELSVIDASGALKTFLEHYISAAHTQDELEPLFLELCSRHRVPRPECQVPLGPYFADFMWPDVGLIVETDGRGSHDGYVAFQEDRVRDRYLKSLGHEVIRFTYAEVVRESDMVAAEVLRSRGRRARGAAP
jgi:very-short-patch-repair endonuclease